MPSCATVSVVATCPPHHVHNGIPLLSRIANIVGSLTPKCTASMSVLSLPRSGLLFVPCFPGCSRKPPIGRMLRISRSTLMSTSFGYSGRPALVPSHPSCRHCRACRQWCCLLMVLALCRVAPEPATQHGLLPSTPCQLSPWTPCSSSVRNLGVWPRPFRFWLRYSG